MLVPDGKGFLLDFACGGGRKNWVESKGYYYIGFSMVCCISNGQFGFAYLIVIGNYMESYGLGTF